MIQPSVDLKPWIRRTAAGLDLDLCGIAPAVVPSQDRQQYLWWLEQGFQGEMKYMERQQRQDIRQLLPSVRSVICAAMVYDTPYPKSIERSDPARGWISRYAWGEDYHEVLQARLEKLLEQLRGFVAHPFEAKIYVDTGPLLERAMARAAGLGWIAKNTCLIHEKLGSWFFLGEILTSLELEPDQPVADRCGTCTRCLEACPTQAIVEPYVLDATRCISYFTIEMKGAIPKEFRPAVGRHVFGCDICQDVCPWNRKAPLTQFSAFQPRSAESAKSGPSVFSGPQTVPAIAFIPPLEWLAKDNQSRDRKGAVKNDTYPQETPVGAFNPSLEWLASLTEEEFRRFFRRSPIQRARYRGFLRNVAVAMGNSGLPKFQPVLEKLAEHPDPIVQEHARWALEQLGAGNPEPPNASCRETKS